MNTATLGAGIAATVFAAAAIGTAAAVGIGYGVGYLFYGKEMDNMLITIVGIDRSMKNFNVTAIDQLRVIIIFVGLFLLSITLLAAIIILDHLNIFSLVGIFIIPTLLYFYLKKYFTYSLVLELSADSIEILTSNRKLQLHFDDIRSYKIERYHGVRFDIKLKSDERLTIIASNNFGSNPEVLEEFCNQFAKQIKGHQTDTSVYIEQKKAFFETNFWFYFVILISIVGLGGVVIAIFTKGFSINMHIVIVPILFLLSALLNTKVKQ